MALFVDQNNINNELLLSTTKYNNLHSDFLTQKLLDENKDEYVIENVCYKEDSKIPIIEESAKLQIAKRLVENAAAGICVSDRYHFLAQLPFR